MKISGFAVLSTAAMLGSAAAFSPQVSPGVNQKSMALSMSTPSSKSPMTRVQFIQTAAIATVLSTFTAAGPANAAKYGAFGSSSPEVLDPKSAIIDDDIAKTKAVLAAIQSLKDYRDSVKSIQSDLAANSQANIGPMIRKQFDFGKLRADLNTANSPFDEDTQRGTDRLSRLILQDITELEAANRQKDGVPRSEKRLDIMTKKLDKLKCAFSDYLAFYPAQYLEKRAPSPEPTPAPTPEPATEATAVEQKQD